MSSLGPGSWAWKYNLPRHHLVKFSFFWAWTSTMTCYISWDDLNLIFSDELDALKRKMQSFS